MVSGDRYIDENLKKEADFQDLKVTNFVRKEQERFYCDDATKEMNEFRKKLIGNVSGKYVLDLGCGMGEATLNCLREGAFVTAIDISPKSIEHIKKRAKEEVCDNRLCAKVMDAQHLELENESFDLVIGGGILHHLTDLELVLKEIHRVLKPDGYTVFHEPLGVNPFINIYRFLTPNKRTKDEKPLKMKELKCIFLNLQRSYQNSSLRFILIGLR